MQALAIILIPLAGECLDEPTGYLVTMFSVFLIGSSNSCLEISLFGFSGLLSPVLTQAIMFGDGIAGISISFIRIVTKLVFPSTQAGIRSATMIYFGIRSVPFHCISPTKPSLCFSLSGATLLSCIVSYLYIVRLPYVRDTVDAAASPAGMSLPSKLLIERCDVVEGKSVMEEAAVSEAEVLASPAGFSFRRFLNNSGRSSGHGNRGSGTRSGNLGKATRHTDDNLGKRPRSSSEGSYPASPDVKFPLLSTRECTGGIGIVGAGVEKDATMVELFRLVRPLCLVVLLVFSVTLCCFPGLTSDIKCVLPVLCLGVCTLCRAHLCCGPSPSP